jgi:hypothetical protein
MRYLEMQKAKIEKSNTILAQGIFNYEELAIEVDGEVYSIKDLLKEFDGCDITLRVKK